MQVGVIGLGAMGSAMANNLLKAGFMLSVYNRSRLALAAAEALKVPMPLASLIATRRLALIAQGGSHLDWSAMAKLAARDAGLATTPHSSQ